MGTKASIRLKSSNSESGPSLHVEVANAFCVIPRCDRYMMGTVGLCEDHLAKTRDERDNLSSFSLIEEPIYNTQEDAAMAAANIIKHCILRDDARFEYGICIYGKENGDFVLTQTKKGTAMEVLPCYNSKMKRDSENTDYTLKAIMHSHPIGAYVQEFSPGDYIISCGCQRQNSRLTFNRPIVPIYVVTAMRDWLPSRPDILYYRDEIVSHNGKLWMPKYDTRGSSLDTGSWKDVAVYDNNRDDEYEKGTVVLDNDQKWPLWRNIEGEWKKYVSGLRWTLIKFTPPISPTVPNEWSDIDFTPIKNDGHVVNGYDTGNVQRLAITMAALYTNESINGLTDSQYNKIKSIITDDESYAMKSIIPLTKRRTRDIAGLFGTISEERIV